MTDGTFDRPLVIRAPSFFSKRRIPIVYQSEAAECGLACLAMAAAYHGSPYSLTELRQRFLVSIKGTTLQTLVDIAHKMEFHARAIRLEPSELSGLSRGAILHWDLQHYVVFESSSRSGVKIVDPARGRISLPWQSFSKHFTGVALDLQPADGFEQGKPAPILNIRQVLGRPKGLSSALFQVVALAAVMQGLVILGPMLSQIVIDDAIARADLDLLIVLGAALLVLQLTSAGLSALRSFVLIYIGNHLSFGLETNLLRHLLRQPIGWLQKRHLGDVMSRFGSLKAIEDIIIGTLPSIIINTASFVFSITFMFIYSPLLSGLEVAALFVLLTIRAASFPYIQRVSQEIMELDARVDTTFLETIRGSRTFKLFNAESKRVALWQNEKVEAVNAAVKMQRIQTWGALGSGVLGSLQAIVIWFVGAKLVISGSLSLGMLIAFKAYADQFSSSTISIVSSVFAYRGLRVPLNRLSEIVLAEPEVYGSGSENMSENPASSDIEFKDVSFRYASHEPWVFKNVSFTIRAGSYACIIGPSGHGKSTILKLLLGFESPTEGAILFNEVDLKAYGFDVFRKKVGAVLQDDQLLSGTIADNISFFDIGDKASMIEVAARIANIHDDIAALPMGYKSFVGDMGSSLSSGQRQRVLLARALYRQPSILVLDEGTSHLDHENEDVIMSQIGAMSITRISVAHRDAAKVGADMIIELKDGSVHLKNNLPAPLEKNL